MEAGGGGHRSHVVRQAAHLHLNEQNTQQRTVIDVQQAPLSPHKPRFAMANINKYTRCCTADKGVGGDGPGSHTPCNMPKKKEKRNRPPKTGLGERRMCPNARPHPAPQRQTIVRAYPDVGLTRGKGGACHRLGAGSSADATPPCQWARPTSCPVNTP
jgi:hypothetical protein